MVQFSFSLEMSTAIGHEEHLDATSTFSSAIYKNFHLCGCGISDTLLRNCKLKNKKQKTTDSGKHTAYRHSHFLVKAELV